MPEDFNYNDLNNIKNYNLTGNFIYKVFAWMAIGVFLTGLVAYLGAYVEPFKTILFNNAWFIFPVALIGLFAVALGLSFLVQKLNYNAMLFLFLLYATFVGIIFSSLFAVYTIPSLVTTFFAAGGMYAVMALYGWYTKRNLSGANSVVQMALWGLIIALLVNIFWRNSTFDLIISFFGIIIFAILTSMTLQQLKFIQQNLPAGENKNKLSLMGAFMLYGNFINIFIFLLRFTGQRRR